MVAAETVIGEQVVYARPESLRDVPTHYCPGCTHGVAHRLVAEVLDELGIRERTICVAPVGCAVFAYNYFNVDGCEAPHGRAPAMATGIKRVLPDRIVNKTNGITPRRWLINANPGLTDLLKETVGAGVIDDIERRTRLLDSPIAVSRESVDSVVDFDHDSS